MKEPLLLRTRSEAIRWAVRDFRYLLNRRYPRKQALELVGNRYQLSSDERHLLHRAVFSRKEALFRKVKRVPFKRLQGRPLAIDGHNVIITIEAYLARRPLVVGDDGFVRDISGLSRNFRPSKGTEEALALILGVLRRAKPSKVLFLFDAPISRSGELARRVREWMAIESIPADALAVPVPERILFAFEGVVATSDTAILDRCQEVFDLAGWIIRRGKKGKRFQDGGRKRMEGFLCRGNRLSRAPQGFDTEADGTYNSSAQGKGWAFS